MHTCSHIPFRQRSTVHPIPSSQSASEVHAWQGTVVVVVTVVVVGPPQHTGAPVPLHDTRQHESISLRHRLATFFMHRRALPRGALGHDVTDTVTHSETAFPHVDRHTWHAFGTRAHDAPPSG
jgi:hypothetical protein